MPVQQNNIQQQGVAAGLSAAENVADALRSELQRGDTATSKTKPSENLLKTLLQGSSREAGKSMLSNLLSKLADFTPKKISNQMEREYGSLFESKEENYADKIDLKYLRSLTAQSSKGNSAEKGEEQTGLLKKNDDVRQYIKAYSSFLVNGGSEVKKKVDQLEQRLLKKGKVKADELNQCRTQTAKSVREEVLKQVKRSFYKTLFAQGKLEHALARFGTNKIIEWANLNDRVGGKDFGGHEGEMKSAAKEAAHEAKEEIKDFLRDEFPRALVKKYTVDSNARKGVDQEIDSLLQLAFKAGFDVEAFIGKIPQIMEDQGLVRVIQNNLAPDASADQGQKERQKYQYNPEEEKDVLMEKLRVLYMQVAVFGDWRTKLEVSFKMLRTKNDLIKLGVKMEDVCPDLQKEGRKLAKLKLVQMLNEGFEERACYARLAGPAWKMTERKIKTVLRNLDRLGLDLDDKDLSDMRDEANQKIFTEVEHELSLIDGALAVRDTLYLRRKRKTALQILARVAEESNIPWKGNEVKQLSIAT
ncbi:hypothetical protein ACFL31_00075 [Candidatus Margulisiibacteriota bacterium]